jgi:hypothetical protein
LPRSAALLAAVAFLGTGAALASAWAEEPELPAGLEAPSVAPELPAGLEEGGEPELPAGLHGPPEELPEEQETVAPTLPFELSGFWEARGGARVQDDKHERDASIAETRLQLEADKDVADVSLRATADFILDGLADQHAVDLETGEGFIDLREANLVSSLAANVDAKAGRQILTWGTGDLVFINDLFPKDWNAFFIGRDEAYLKAPSDAVKLSAFSDWVNLDVVYTPRFDADRFIDGRSLSFFDSTRGRIVGRDAVVEADRPTTWFEDDEWAARLYRNLAGYELALYAYDGFWKSPGGIDPTTGRATFPRFSVYGGSARGIVGDGIAHVELGYYDSREDRAGDDPFVRNGEFRFLLGYEQEIAMNLTLGAQYYLERMLDHEAFVRTLPVGAPVQDENRHVLTARLTWLTRKQTLEWSLFAFYSPSDRDAYLRPQVTYDVSDAWTGEFGGSFFLGADDNTFFGQFQDNNNVYAALRYGF